MSAKANTTLVRRYVDEVYNGRDYAVVDELIAEHYTDHVALHEQASGREQFKRSLSVFHTAFPDGKIVAEDVIAAGDRVAWRWSFTGTHQGEFQKIAPTNKAIRWTGIIIWRIEQGQIAEWWAAYDLRSLLQQLGVSDA